MTDQQINVAIHEALGNPIGCPRCSDPECSYNRGLNYCSDLNAMHEACESVFSESNAWSTFVYKLSKIICAGHYTDHDTLIMTNRATARQRAEAFLRTLGKWEKATDKESLTVQPTTEKSSVDHLRDVTKMMGKEVQG